MKSQFNHVHKSPTVHSKSAKTVTSTSRKVVQQKPRSHFTDRFGFRETQVHASGRWMCISRMRNLSFVKGDIMEDVNGRPVQAGQEPEGRLPPTTYTLPGVLHFIQHEWTKFERERSRWDVERAELQVSSLSTCAMAIGIRIHHTTELAFLTLPHNSCLNCALGKNSLPSRRAKRTREFKTWLGAADQDVGVRSPTRTVW